MLSLTRPQRDRVKFKGKTYRLKLSFDNVLLYYELLKEKNIPESLTLEIGLSLLLKGKRWKRLESSEQFELLKIINQNFLKTSDRQPSGDDVKVMDFTEDADFIFSSFYVAYGIDLEKERGKMHWQTFSALLNGLPEGTKLREVINIRTAEIPDPDKYNQKSRRQLIEAKRYYALKNTENKSMTYQEGVQALFYIAKNMAKN